MFTLFFQSRSWWIWPSGVKFGLYQTNSAATISIIVVYCNNIYRDWFWELGKDLQMSIINQSSMIIDYTNFDNININDQHWRQFQRCLTNFSKRSMLSRFKTLTLVSNEWTGMHNFSQTDKSSCYVVKNNIGQKIGVQ